jgi:hypothetical protein
LTACSTSSSMSRVVRTPGIISHHASDVNGAFGPAPRLTRCSSGGDKIVLT